MAAETLDRQLPAKYRSPGCMAAYLATHPDADTRGFVTDYVSGRPINAERAFYVPVLVNDKTGERDFRAFHSSGRSPRSRPRSELNVCSLEGTPRAGASTP